MLAEFLKDVIEIHKSGDATEHSYRPAFKKLFDSIHTKVTAQNEPKREKVGAPDFVFRRGDIDKSRVVNFNENLYANLRKQASIRPPSFPSATFNPQAGEARAHFTGASPGEEANEVDVFDYIYGVVHCSAHRETYAEFLKIDFPRIPWPETRDVFWSVREKGGQLRRLHLMEEAAIGDTPYPFETVQGEEGNNIVDKPTFKNSRVYINRAQYFENVPKIAWGFHIGGYQPAQKWLKDRKGRELSFEDIRHYQKIIKVLDETDRTMKTIEMPLNSAKVTDSLKTD